MKRIAALAQTFDLPVVPHQTQITLPDRPGHDLEIDEKALAKLTAS